MHVGKGCPQRVARSYTFGQHILILTGGLGYVMNDRHAGCAVKSLGAYFGWLGRLGTPGRRAETSALTNLRRGAVAWAVVIASAAAVAAAGTGPAVATTVRIKGTFTCSSSTYGTTSMTVRGQANAPDSAVVGEAVPGVIFKVAAMVGPHVTAALNFVGATRVKGTAEATALVAAPQGDTRVTVPVTISDARVPASGPMTLDAAGITPRFRFTRPGTAKISLLSISARMTPVTSDGMAPVGPVEATCEPDPGHNSVLYEIPVMSGVGATPTPPAQQSPGPPPGTHGAAARPTAPASAVPGTGSPTPARRATSARPTAPAPALSRADSPAPTRGATSARPTASVSDTAGPSRSAGSGLAPWPAVLGAMVAGGGALGIFLWFRRRPGRGAGSGG